MASKEQKLIRSLTGNKYAPQHSFIAGSPDGEALDLPNHSGIVNNMEFKKMLLSIYPVGSVYTTNNSSFDPNVSFGGTWSKTGAGRVLVGQDTNQTEFDTIGETGGSKTHTLIDEELPPLYVLYDTVLFKNGTGANVAKTDVSGVGLSSAQITGASEVGQSVAHNNLQPYQVVIFWLRTA